MNINRINRYTMYSQMPQINMIMMCGTKYDFNLKILIEYYNKHQFLYINEFIYREYHGINYWLCYNKVETLTYFRLLIKIKQRLRIRINEIRKKKCKIGNEYDLMYNELEGKETINIYTLSLGIIHRFTLNDIVKIIRYSILYNDLDISKSKPPMNPYNNMVFTNGQIIQIYQYVLKEYCKKGRVLPTYIINYKSVYFDIEQYKATYYMKNNIHAYLSYINTLNNNEWINEYNMYVNIDKKKEWCKVCLFKRLSIDNIRKLFTPVILLAFLNRNKIMEFGRYETLYYDILDKYKINRIHQSEDEKINNESDGYTTEDEEYI